MKRRRSAAALTVVAALLVTLPPAAGRDGVLERPEVLQAVFHPLASPNWTREGLDERCVLMEQRADGASAEVEDARAAAEALLNNTTRRQLAYAEYGADETRFSGYYRVTLVPTAIFDGLGYVSGGGSQTQLHAQAAYDEAAKYVPLASINVSSTVVVTTGSLAYEVFAPTDLSGFVVSIRGAIVEDVAPEDGVPHPVRYLVRQYLAGDRIDLTGNAAVSGQIEFTLQSTWVRSRLAAVLFVQVDTVPAGSIPSRGGGGASTLGAVAAPLAALATGGVLAVMLARYITAERRARLR